MRTLSYQRHRSRFRLIDTGAWPLNRYVLEIHIPDDLWAAAESPSALGTLPPV